jgi:hypothetical protein
MVPVVMVSVAVNYVIIPLDLNYLDTQVTSQLTSKDEQ